MAKETRLISFYGESTEAVIEELQMCIDEDNYSDVFRVVLQYRDMLERGLATVCRRKPKLTNDPVMNAFLAGAIIDGLKGRQKTRPNWVLKCRLKEGIRLDWGRTREEHLRGIDTTPLAWKAVNIQVSKADVTNL